MPDFTLLPCYAGIGPFHFNRYRVVFQRPAGITAPMLAGDFVANFPQYLNSKYANVRWGRNFGLLPTLKFHGYMKMLGIDAGYPHNDWVVRVWCNPNVGFTAQTAKREFSESPDDELAAAAGATPGVLWTMVDAVLDPLNLVQREKKTVAKKKAISAGAEAAVEINRTHFLAGRRSWRIDRGEVFGLPGDVYVLETVALERFSNAAYNTADRLLTMEKMIPDIWIANLANFITMNGLKTVAPDPKCLPEPRGDWLKAKMLDIHYLVKFESTMDGLMRHPAFLDACRLFPTVLPAQT
jgi:hypothetical protein